MYYHFILQNPINKKIISVFLTKSLTSYTYLKFIYYYYVPIIVLGKIIIEKYLLMSRDVM